MAFLIRDFVKETTTVTGTGPATLLGARAPGQTFSAALSNGDTCDYAISHQTANEWEVGTGTYNAGVLTRTTVTASSNGGAAVAFSIGTKSVDLVDPAQRIGRRVGPVVIGASSLGLGSLSFSNLNGVSFGLSTDSNGGTITASVAGGGGGGGITQFSALNLNGSLSEYTGLTATGPSIGLQSSATSDSTAYVSRNVSFAFSGSNMAAHAIFGVYGLNSTGGAQAISAQQFSIRQTNGIRVSLFNSTFAGFGRLPIFELDHDGVRQVSIGTVPSLNLSAMTDTAFTGLPLLQLRGTSTSASDLFSSANVSWAMSTSAGSVRLGAAAAIGFIGPNTAGAGTNLSAQYLSFRSSNGISFTLHDSTFANFGRIALLELSAPPQLGLVSHVGGNSVSNVTRLAFSNASNVTFSLSTAASAATLFASVAAGGGGGADGFGTVNLVSGFSSNSPAITDATDSSITGSQLAFPLMGTVNNTNLSYHNVSFRLSSDTLMGAAWHNFLGGASAVSGQNLSFANSNGCSWTLDSTTAAGFGRIPRIALRAAIAFSAGTLFQFQQNLGFADAPGLSWTYAGSQVTAIPLNSGLHVVSDSATSNNFSRLAFSAANGLTLGISTGASAATVTGSYTVPTLTSLSFSNANNVSFGIAGSTLTASASFAAAATREIGVVSHIGGNVVSSVSQLAFSNASNVTFSLSTAANAATLIASVAAGGGGGVTHAGFMPNWGAAVIVTQSLSNGSFWVQPLANSPAFSFDRMVQLFGLSNATNATNSNTLRLYAGLYSRNASTLSLISSSSTSVAFTGSGTVGNYSLFSGARNLSMGWGASLPEGDFWVGVGASLLTAGNSSFSISFGMLSQTVNAPVYGFGAASNATFQSALGKGFLSATTSAPPSSIAFSQIQGTNSVAYRFPALFFGSGSA